MSAIGPSDNMRDHWWWRPGWRVGRRMYTWHVTFDGQSRIQELVAAYQTVLSSLPGLDPIPSRWLHLTMQGIAFTDEIGEQEIGAIVQAAQKRLANTEQVALTVGPALVDPEAIMLEVHPLNALTPVRSSIRAAIADVQGPAKVPEADEWTPHISLAYSNGADPAAPYIDAINAVIFPPVELTVSTVRLIELSRDTHLYEWKTIAEVPLSH